MNKMACLEKKRGAENHKTQKEVWREEIYETAHPGLRIVLNVFTFVGHSSH
jgi:hypothetical protein